MAMLSSTAGSGSGFPVGYEGDMGGGGGRELQTRQPTGGYSSTSAVSQLFARLSQEIEEKQPKNCIHFMVDFLCKHYPEHLHGFASIWQMDPDLERERHEVVNFFKAHKISTAVAAHFTNAGYDTLDTLTTLSPDSLVDIEAFNNVKWLPGHKVRLQQIFGEISARVRAYRQQYEQMQQASPHGRNSSPPHRRHSPHGHASSSHHTPSQQPVRRTAAPVSHAHSAASPYSAAAAHGAAGHQALAAHSAAAAVAAAAGHPSAAHAAHSAAAMGHQASSLYGHTGHPGHTGHAGGMGAPMALNTGIGQGLSGHGVPLPALPAGAGNLFQHYGNPYPQS